MKKLFAATVMILILAMPVLTQEAVEFEDTDIEEYVVGHVPVMPRIQSPDHNPWVKALCIGLVADYPPKSYYVILETAVDRNNQYRYPPPAEFWIVFVIANYSNSKEQVKIEMELIHEDGGKRIYKKNNTTILSGEVMQFVYPVHDMVSRAPVNDLFTLNGRVSGAGMGNSNEVKTQVLIY